MQNIRILLEVIIFIDKLRNKWSSEVRISVLFNIFKVVKTTMRKWLSKDIQGQLSNLQIL